MHGTSGYSYTNLHRFGGGTNDGGNPNAGLAIDLTTNTKINTNGNLYGTTSSGDSSSNGNIFALTKQGSGFSFSVLHTCADIVFMVERG